MERTGTTTTIIEDGQTLRGSEWTTPEDLIEMDIASGLLVTLKGMTDVELPELEPSR